MRRMIPLLTRAMYMLMSRLERSHRPKGHNEMILDFGVTLYKAAFKNLFLLSMADALTAST